MAKPLLAVNLKRILLRLLPSPEIKLAGQQLRISNHLDMISDSLWGVNAVILNINLRASKEPELRKWLGDVETGIIDVENILHVIQDSYNQPKEQQKQKVTMPPNFLLSSRRHALLVELKSVAQSLNCLLSRMNAFGLQIDMMESMDPNQDDYYSIMQQEVVGRDNDVKRILQIMFQLQEQEEQLFWDIKDHVPFFIAITGPKRIGKSMLARMVYHHPLVRDVFKHRIWVDVLNSIALGFDHRQIARECVRCVTGGISSDVDIWNLLRRSLPQTKFLLVLDGFHGITTEDIDKLEKLRKYLLSFSAPGSRVIITCRSYPIVHSDKEYRVNHVSGIAWSKLFMRYARSTAQSDRTEENFPMNLLFLASKIYPMEEHRYPIVAKNVGTIMRQTNLSYYDFMKESYKFTSLIHFHYDEHEFTQIILYSVLSKPLPSSFINGCFDMSMAEGTFKYSTKSRQRFQLEIFFSLIKLAQFSTLIGPLFFNIKKSIYHFNKRNGQEFKFPQQCRYLCLLVDSNTSTFLTNLQTRIVNNLRMLMLYKVKEEMNLQPKNYQEASSIDIPKSLNKNLIILSIIDTGIQQLPKTISMLRSLRYLNISENEIEELPQFICDLYNLHILSLSNCKKLLKLPKQIYKLTKLHILRLAYCTRLQKLPKSITRLVNLQVLDIEACYWLKELPEELRHLERLMNLCMIGCASLSRLPIAISKLTILEALLGYIVEENDYERSLQELQSLTSIEELHIRHLECVLNINAITSVNLKEKQYLEKLLLDWDWWNMHVRENNQLESFKALDGLQPNVSHLKKLQIVSYFGKEFPNWMMMDEQLLQYKSLVAITLVNLKRCENLPSLGRIHSLAQLEISGMESVTCIGSSRISNDEHTFLKLVKLTLSEMPTLVQWNLRCSSLQELTLIHCPNLISLCGFDLKNKLNLWLQSKLLGQYSSYFLNIFKNIKQLEIVGCHEMRRLPKEIQKCERLQTLSIIRCSKLLSVPDWLQEMPSLRQMFLAGCTTISYIPKKLKQQLKDHIIVQGCSKTQAQTRREKYVK